ncbi:MAG: class I adenylate cyclase, partial [Natronospirillum sp.]
LESYLEDRNAGGGMLCHELKRRVYDDEVSPDRLDPYVMMYERIAAYLSDPKHQERLYLVQRCFYSKIGITLSRPLNRGRTHWRRELITSLVRSWGWTLTDMKELDQRENWGIQQALTERHNIMREFTQSYRNMTRFAQQLGVETFMKQEDMLTLGRKLQANFDRKPGKIEVLNEEVAPNLSQEKVTLHKLPGKNGGPSLWAAFVDLPLHTKPEDYPPPLKYARGFLEVLLWCHMNGLLTGHLHVPVFSPQTRLTDFEVKELISSLRQDLKYPVPAPPQDAFRSKSFVKRVAIYVNVGVDPMASLSQRGLQKISSRVDSLDFSAVGENLVRTLDRVTLSNWHEVVCTRYASNDALIQLLQCFF